MKVKGVIKDIDPLGRIVIPKPIRDAANIDKEDIVEIHVEGDCIVISKHVPFCTFCGAEENLTEFCGKKVCRNCIEKIKNK